MKHKLLLIALLISISLCSCGGSSLSSSTTNSKSADYYTSELAGASISNAFTSSNYEYESSDDYASPSMTPNSSETVQTSSDEFTELSDEKLIYRANFTLESIQYNDDYSTIKSLLSQYGGIVESEYYSQYEDYRGYAVSNIHTRIPSKSYKEFTNNL